MNKPICFGIYVDRILKDIDGNVSLTKEIKLLFDNIITYFIKQNAMVINTFKQNTKSKTLSSRDIQTATYILFNDSNQSLSCSSISVQMIISKFFILESLVLSTVKSFIGQTMSTFFPAIISIPKYLHLSPKR